MNEATVRTRLSRGRQMLKDKVSAMVERTLEKTGPGKQFTKAVMVSIGAGLAAGTAATAAGTTAGSLATAGGATTAATGILAATGVKIAAIAAAVIIGTGAVVYHYWNPSDKAESVTQTAAIEPPQELDRQVAANSEHAALAYAVNAVAKEVALENKAQEIPVQVSPVSIPEAVSQPVIAHADWPGIQEPLKYVHVTWTTIDQDDTEASEEIWFRLSDGFRYEPCVGDIIIDDGRQRLVLDPNTRQAQLEPTWFVDGNYYLYGSPKPLRDHPGFPPIQLFRDKQPNPDIELTKIPEECNASSEVYFLKDLSLTDPNAVVTRIWVDKRTGLPEKIEGIYTGPLHQNDTRKKALITYDYSPLSDALFSLEIPADYQTLPAKPQKGFSGRVIDLLGQPVARAEVYVNFFPLWGLDYLKAVSDNSGQFEIRIPDVSPLNTSGVNLPFYFWAILPDRQDFAAWTILYEDCDYLDFDKDLIPGYGGTIVSEREVITGTRTENGVTTPYPTLSSSLKYPVVKDIVLVMQPTGTIAGYVMDKDGYSISGAQLTCKYQFGAESGKIFPLYSDHFKWTFSATSEANGYYAIKQLPSLWKYCRFSITVSAPGYTGEIKELILEEPLSHLDYNISLNLQQVTIRGILRDNYGIALADRWIALTAPNINLKDCSAKTDPNGMFEMKGCPDIDGLGLEAQLAWSNPYDMINQREQYDKMLYYPNVGINIPYSPNQKEYNIELTAIRPETQVDIFVTNSFGNPIPEMKVELDGHLDRNRHFNICWQRDKLQKRTNAEGFVKFDNIPPDAEELRVHIQQATDYILEGHRLDPFKERQRLQNLDRDYANLYQQMVIPIKIVPGQKKYQMTIVIPTKEEFKQQKESASVESLPHNP
jgi:hypothetical protein